METRHCAVAVAGVLLTLTGCGGGTGDQGGAAATTLGQASCTDDLTLRHHTWTDWPLRHKMTRDLVGPAIHTVQFPCLDVGGESPGDPKTVTLRAIKGIPPSQALFRINYFDKMIYVPNGIETRIEDLPRKVRHLILHG